MTSCWNTREFSTCRDLTLLSIARIPTNEFGLALSSISTVVPKLENYEHSSKKIFNYLALLLHWENFISVNFYLENIFIVYNYLKDI